MAAFLTIDLGRNMGAPEVRFWVSFDGETVFLNVFATGSKTEPAGAYILAFCRLATAFSTR